MLRSSLQLRETIELLLPCLTSSSPSVGWVVGVGGDVESGITAAFTCASSTTISHHASVSSIDMFGNEARQLNEWARF